MKNTENNKNLYRRYLDDLYTTENAREICALSCRKK